MFDGSLKMQAWTLIRGINILQELLPFDNIKKGVLVQVTLCYTCDCATTVILVTVLLQLYL